MKYKIQSFNRWISLQTVNALVMMTAIKDLMIAGTLIQLLLHKVAC